MGKKKCLLDYLNSVIKKKIFIGSLLMGAIYYVTEKLAKNPVVSIN